MGFLEQEPELEKGKTVKEIVEEGVQETVDLLREYEDINAQFAEPMDDDAMKRPDRAAGHPWLNSLTQPGLGIWTVA